MSFKLHWDNAALATFRVALGLTLAGYTLIALFFGGMFFTDYGVLPMSSLARLGGADGSLYLATRWWLWAYLLLSIQLILSLCLALGFRMKFLVIPLAYLVWSLKVRNPLIAGVSEEWFLWLILACGVLPTTRVFALETAPSRFQSNVPEPILNVLGYLAILLVPLSLLQDSLAIGSSLWLSLLGLLSLFGLLVPLQHPIVRNLAVLMFWLWAGLTVAPGAFWVVAFVSGLPFLQWEGRAVPGESVAKLLVRATATLLLLQLPILLSVFGYDPLARNRDILNSQGLDNYQRFQIVPAPSNESPEPLWAGLESKNFLMERYLNRLYVHVDQQLVALLLSSQMTDAKGKTFSVSTLGSGGERSYFLYQIEIPVENSPIWKRMPRLDRKPLEN